MQLEHLELCLGRITKTVKTPIKYKASVGGEPLFLEESEISRIIAFANEYTPRGVPNGALRNTTLLTLAINTGLRVRELHLLNIEDVDLEHRWVRVFHGKGNKYRRVPLNQETTDALIEYVTALALHDGPFFKSRTGKRLAVRTIQWLVETYGRNSGISKIRDGRLKNLSPHKLRHTFGTQLARKNVQQVKIQEMMGHASRLTTDKYVHAAGTHDDVEKLTTKSVTADERADRLETKLDRLTQLLEDKL